MYKEQANAARRREPALKPPGRTLGTFHPKGFPRVAIPVKILLDGDLSLSYETNGSLTNISDATAKAKILDMLSRLDEQQNISDTLAMHRQAGMIHITDHEMLATIIYRSHTLDLRQFGIRMSPVIRDKAFKKLEGWDHPTNNIILGTNQLKKS